MYIDEIKIRLDVRDVWRSGEWAHVFKLTHGSVHVPHHLNDEHTALIIEYPDEQRIEIRIQNLRPFFVCPHCGRLVMRMFLLADVWRCQYCGELKYRSHTPRWILNAETELLEYMVRNKVATSATLLAASDELERRYALQELPTGGEPGKK